MSGLTFTDSSGREVHGCDTCASPRLALHRKRVPDTDITLHACCGCEHQPPYAYHAAETCDEVIDTFLDEDEYFDYEREELTEKGRAFAAALGADPAKLEVELVCVKAEIKEREREEHLADIAEDGYSIDQYDEMDDGEGRWAR